MKETKTVIVLMPPCLHPVNEEIKFSSITNLNVIKTAHESAPFDYREFVFGILGKISVTDSFSGGSFFKAKLPLCSSVTRCATKR